MDRYRCRQNNRQHKVVNTGRQNVLENIPEVSTYPKRTIVLPGSDVILDCRIEAEPLTTRVSWTKNDQRVQYDQRVQLEANNSLRIHNTRPSDRALYKCRASNRLGQSWDGIQLIVDGEKSSKYSGSFLVIVHKLCIFTEILVYFGHFV